MDVRCIAYKKNPDNNNTVTPSHPNMRVTAPYNPSATADAQMKS